MGANFAPILTDPSSTNPFVFWCQKILPCVFDDSLSYYEVLCKMKTKLNEIISNSNLTNENIIALNEAYKKLEQYVNDYFEQANIGQMVESALDEMAENGTLYEYVVSRITAEDVHARPDNWFPTIQEIGAAPSGYGLGVVGYSNYRSVTDPLIENGWYYIPDGASPVGQAGIIRVDSARDDTLISQTLYLASGGYQGSVMRRVKALGNWRQWEWINPPLSLNIEYPTTERVGSKPVWCKRINVRVTTPGSAYQDLDIAHGITNFGSIVRCVARRGAITLPFSYQDKSLCVYWVSADNIKLRSTNYSLNNETVSFDIYYTRND